jgi:hypothetical protein
MLTIKGPSEKPCFICGSKTKTAEVQFADKTFRGVLCMDDVYKKVQPGKEVTNAESQPGRKSP